MKKKELTDFRKKEIKDLRVLLEKKRVEAMASLAGLSIKEKNLRKNKNLRREIAQILTIIREKEIISSTSK